MEQKNKANIKIENLTSLSLQNSLENKEKIKSSDMSSELASFRLYFEGQDSVKSSDTASPSHMGLLQISPIEAIIHPSRNFTTESSNFLQNPFQSNFIRIMPTETDDEDEDIEKSINLLTPSLKKEKFNQYTPTFPLKSDDNVSWADISILSIQENNKKLPQEPEFSNNPNPDEGNLPSIVYTLSDLPTLIDEQIFRSQKSQASDEKNSFNKSDSVEKDECKENTQDKDNSLMKQIKETNENREVVEAARVLKESSTEPVIATKVIEKPKATKLVIKKVHCRALSHLRIGGDSRLKIMNTEEAFPSTPLVKKTEKVEMKNQTRSRSNGKVRLKVRSEDPKLQKRAKNSLPELKDVSKPKLKPTFSPYLTTWSTTNAKSQFNLESKKQKDATIKSLVTKVTKRRVKVLK